MRSRAIAFLLLLLLTVSVRGELLPRIDRALCFGDPEIVGAQLSPGGRDLAFQSSDGLEVPASLTQPRGVPARKPPPIVIPHGGPWRRDTWGDNTYSQFFASRGYAVLQPNFRASAGFGKELLDTGNLRWGEKMQDDGADAGHTTTHPICHPERESRDPGGRAVRGMGHVHGAAHPPRSLDSRSG